MNTFARRDQAPGFAARLPAAALAGLLAASGASAQWTVVLLHPASLPFSLAVGADGGQQVGSNGVWTGSAESYVPLGGAVFGVGSGQQVGRYIAPPPGRESACYWTGSAASRVNLHPAGTLLSEAHGADAGRQVGFVAPSTGLPPRAALWSGTAESVVYLTPVGMFGRAFGIGGDQQVGEIRDATVISAALWRGTAASLVNLQPAGRTFSMAFATDGTQQVGDVRVGVDGQGFPILHAALWRGTAASFVDLHPPGAVNSGARDVAAGEQVGYVTFSGSPFGNNHAVIWSGSAASVVDLHPHLPPGYSSSVAHAIWKNGPVTQVVGGAVPAGSQDSRAVMWIRNTCRPDFNHDATLNADDLSDYITCFFAGPACAAGEFNGDGARNADDLSDYITAFFAGCP